MSTDPTPVEGVAGERTASPVSGPVVDSRRTLQRRGIAVVALLAFGSGFLWGGSRS